ncbi:citrate/2-methylcitrate synthase [Virgibacillus flavescens]|uniref:citrate/2-methylcitrate synthase n=1 Tax=Virgibacillus flavescens TaxID=1611422 RepID=UPI003D359872
MYQPGLKGVVACETMLSNIDGERGILTYRGEDIQYIVNNYSFEQVAYFLLHGNYPNNNELNLFIKKLKDFRTIPANIKEIIDRLSPEHSLMDTLRTAISALTLDKHSDLDNAIHLIAVTPAIIAYRYRQMNNLPNITADYELDHVPNFLHILTDNVNTSHAKMLEVYLIMTMEHSLNASTFAARVTISTQSDIVSAITSAIGTMKGPLHGGAPSGVIQLLEEIGSEDNISKVIHTKLENKERIMGFGHRVYKTLDPRAEALKTTIMSLESKPDWIELALKTEKETIRILSKYKPNQKLYTNVEYYAAAIMKSLDIDSELFTPIFSSSRIVGWCAHAIEQKNNNVIFRPAAKYTGN